MIWGVQKNPNAPQSFNQIKHFIKDSDEDLNNNNNQRPAKVRSKTVPEAHLEAQKAYGDIDALTAVVIFGALGPPKVISQIKVPQQAQLD